MKRILASILSVTVLAAALPASLTGCQKSDTESTAVSEQKTYPTKQTLYYKDSARSSKAVATFFNSDTKQSEEVEMKKVALTAIPSPFPVMAIVPPTIWFM